MEQSQEIKTELSLTLLPPKKMEISNYFTTNFLWNDLTKYLLLKKDHSRGIIFCS